MLATPHPIRAVRRAIAMAAEPAHSPEISAALLRIALSRANRPLRDELIWRIDQLGDIQLDSWIRRDAFDAVLQGFKVPPFRQVMMSEHCECSVAGHRLVVGGEFRDGPKLVATWVRELRLDSGIVVHRYLEVEPPYRRFGVGPGLLKAGLALYDELGMEHVFVRASLDTGRWYWARAGFDFADEGQRAIVTDFFDDAVKTLGLNIDSSAITDPSEYALIAPEVTASMREVAEAMYPPQGQQDMRERAEANGHEYDEQIPAAEAIMLCGPEWIGTLRLSSPKRIGFEQFIDSRLAAVARRAAEAG